MKNCLICIRKFSIMSRLLPNSTPTLPNKLSSNKFQSTSKKTTLLKYPSLSTSTKKNRKSILLLFLSLAAAMNKKVSQSTPYPTPLKFKIKKRENHRGNHLNLATNLVFNSAIYAEVLLRAMSPLKWFLMVRSKSFKKMKIKMRNKLTLTHVKEESKR